MSLDLWIFETINGLAGHTPILDQVMQACVSDYVGPTLQVLGLLGFWFEANVEQERRENQRTVIRAILTLFVASFFVSLCNSVYFRDRPFRYNEVNMLFYYPTDSSFPSNSAAVVFSFSTVVWLRNRRWGWWMITFATLFAVSRVYTGVHYPADILGGFALGAGSAWLITRCGNRLNRFFDVIIDVSRRLYLA